MCKSIIALAPVALLMMSIAGPSQAAKSGELLVTANISAATCDVNLSTPLINLGNWTQSSFSGVADKEAIQTEDVDVTLMNCSDPGIFGTASLIVTGTTLSVDNAMFNSSSDADVGITVTKLGSPTLIKSGEKVELKSYTGSAGDEPTGADLDILSQKFTVGLAGLTSSPSTKGEVKAPIVFHFDYN